MFASEYGWTIEQFLQLTFTQMYYIAKALQKRNAIKFHSEASLHAQLHGAKIKPLEDLIQNDTDAPAFDEKTESTFEKIALQRLKEAQAKNGR